jgi:effector-binding domain-containing protein
MTTIMPVEPVITQRPAQPYVAIRRLVTMQTINEIADRVPEVFGWLRSRGIAPTGAPFLKYNVIDMERELEVEAGVPVETPVAPDEPVLAGVLPAGRYVSLTHRGHPDRLVDVTAALLAWAEQRGLAWDAVATDAGQRWGCRLEIFHTNPAEEADINKWETELAFRLADS